MARLAPETFDAARDGMKRSAATVLPIVFDTIGTPSALLDVGCGPEAWWCVEAARIAPEQIRLGVDIDQEPGDLAYWDAEAGTPLPTLFEATGFMQENAGHRWPLTLCLEMAEHVSPAAGRHLVSELCRVSDLVLWSAAIPGQGGDGHVNEQWPEYWREAFEAAGWRFRDPFRDRLWGCPDVEPWYRQNLLLAAPADSIWGAGAPDSVRALVDPVTWAHHRGVPAPGVV